MARGTGTVIVKFLGDVSDLKKSTEDASGAMDKVGGAVKGVTKALVVGGIPALVGFGVAAVKQFGDSEQVAAQTAAAIKSTGGAAHVTLGQVSDLAGSLSMLSGTDDEVIQSGENMLLTFTNIQNRVGKGNDIFNQATATALDMSTALGEDMSSASMQLGKALNDPVKGITALQRVGVQFTEQQKQQIQSMVKSGDVAGAQKVILQELQKEFGGSAKAAGDTFAGGINKAKVQIGNFMEDVGGKIAPFITGFMNAFGEGGVGGAFKYLVQQFQAAWPSIQAALGQLMSNIGQWITGTALPYLQAQFPVWVDAAWKWIQQVTPPALQALGELLGNIGTWLLQTGLPKLGAALVELGKALWHWIQDNGPATLEKLGGWLEDLGKWILTTGIPKLVGFLANMAVKLIDWISDTLPKLPGKLGEFVGAAAAWILTTGIPKTVEFMAKMGEKLIGFIIDVVPKIPGEMVKFVGAIGDWMKTNGPGLLKDGLEVLGGAITAPFKFAFNTVAGFWNDTVGKISFHVPDWVPGIGGKGFDFPKIPVLDSGGIVSSPTLALLAANSRPEAVVPLGSGALGGNTVNVYMGVVGDPAAAARQIQSLLLQEKRRSGALGLA